MLAVIARHRWSLIQGTIAAALALVAEFVPDLRGSPYWLFAQIGGLWWFAILIAVALPWPFVRRSRLRSAVDDRVATYATTGFATLTNKERAELRRLWIARQLWPTPALTRVRQKTDFVKGTFAGHFELNEQFAPWLEFQFADPPKRRDLIVSVIGLVAVLAVGAWLTVVLIKRGTLVEAEIAAPEQSAPAKATIEVTDTRAFLRGGSLIAGGILENVGQRETEGMVSISAWLNDKPFTTNQESPTRMAIGPGSKKSFSVGPSDPTNNKLIMDGKVMLVMELIVDYNETPSRCVRFHWRARLDRFVMAMITLDSGWADCPVSTP